MSRKGYLSINALLFAKTRATELQSLLKWAKWRVLIFDFSIFSRRKSKVTVLDKWPCRPFILCLIDHGRFVSCSKRASSKLDSMINVSTFRICCATFSEIYPRSVTQARLPGLVNKSASPCPQKKLKPTGS